MKNANAISFSFLMPLEDNPDVSEGGIYRGRYAVPSRRIGTWQRTTHWNGYKSYSARLFEDGLQLEFDSFEELRTAVNRYAN